MVLIGLETTRFGVGIGRVNANIYYGSFIFVLMAISGMLIVLNLKDKPRDAKTKSITMLISTFSGLFYGIAYWLAIYHTINYNLNSLNLYLLAFIGIFWFLSLYYGRDWKYKGVLINIIISVSFSFGLIYGASLNNIVIPAVIYLFFGAVFLLQISKDLINACKHIEREGREKNMSIVGILGEEKSQKLSVILDILVIIFLIIPMFPGFPNIFAQTFYTIIAIIAIIFACIAVLLSFRMNNERKYYKLVKILLRCVMFLTFTAFILANF